MTQAVSGVKLQLIQRPATKTHHLISWSSTELRHKMQVVNISFTPAWLYGPATRSTQQLVLTLPFSWIKKGNSDLDVQPLTSSMSRSDVYTKLLCY